MADDKKPTDSNADDKKASENEEAKPVETGQPEPDSTDDTVDAEIVSDEDDTTGGEPEEKKTVTAEGADDSDTVEETAGPATPVQEGEDADAVHHETADEDPAVATDTTPPPEAAPSNDNRTSKKKQPGGLSFVLIGALAAVIVAGIAIVSLREPGDTALEDESALAAGEGETILFPAEDETPEVPLGGDTAQQETTAGAATGSDGGAPAAPAAPVTDEDPEETAVAAADEATSEAEEPVEPSQEAEALVAALGQRGAAEEEPSSAAEPSEEAVALVAALNEAEGERPEAQTAAARPEREQAEPSEDALALVAALNERPAAPSAREPRTAQEAGGAAPQEEVTQTDQQVEPSEEAVSLVAALGALSERERMAAAPQRADEDGEAAMEETARVEPVAPADTREGEALVTALADRAERRAAEQEAAAAASDEQATEAPGRGEEREVPGQEQAAREDDTAASQRIAALRRLAENRAAQRRAASEGERGTDEQEPVQAEPSEQPQQEAPGTPVAVIPEERIETLRREIVQDVSSIVEEATGNVRQDVKSEVLAETSERIDSRFAETRQAIQQTERAVTETQQAVQQTERAVSETQAEVRQTARQVEQLQSILSQQQQQGQQQIRQLDTRIRDLQTRSVDVARRGDLLVALTDLADNIDAGQPFRRQLNVVEAITGGSEDLSTLRAFADDGIPTTDELRARFDAAAREALAGSRRDDAEGVFDKLAANVAGLFSVRPVGDVEGDTPGAIIARAETRLEGGNVDAAVEELRQLEGSAYEAFAPWIAGARAKAVADNALADLESRVASPISD